MKVMVSEVHTKVRVKIMVAMLVIALLASMFPIAAYAVGDTLDVLSASSFVSSSDTSSLSVEYVEERGYTSMAITSDRTLWIWGDNYSGQLGDETLNSSAIPVRTLENVSSAIAENGIVVALKTDGTLWTWGEGWLGDGKEERYRPAKIMSDVVRVEEMNGMWGVYKSDGSLWTWGGGLSKRATKAFDNARSFAYQSDWEGERHAVISSDGELWMWGTNGNGQIGNGTTTAVIEPTKILGNVAKVWFGDSHTVALKDDGTLWTWGGNAFGELGDGTYADRALPEKVLDGVSEAYVDNYSTAALKSDGSFLTWGYTPWGAGVGSVSNADTHTSTPTMVLQDVKSVAVGRAMAAIKSDDTLWTWGENEWWGLGDETAGYSTTVPNKILDDVCFVSSGYALKNDGTLLTWGRSNEEGGLGNGTTEGTKAPTKILENISRVTGDNMNGFAISDGGALYAWGNNSYGCLGDGTKTRRLSPTLIFSDGQWLQGYKVPSENASGADTKNSGVKDNSGSKNNALNSPSSVIAGAAKSKAANPMKVKAKKVTVKYGKKKSTVKPSAAYRFKKKAVGAVTYTRVKKGSSKWLSKVNSRTGAITVKAGAPKGKTYKVKVKITAAGDFDYQPVSKTVTVKVKVVAK